MEKHRKNIKRSHLRLGLSALAALATLLGEDAGGLSRGLGFRGQLLVVAAVVVVVVGKGLRKIIVVVVSKNEKKDRSQAPISALFRFNSPLATARKVHHSLIARMRRNPLLQSSKLQSSPSLFLPS